MGNVIKLVKNKYKDEEPIQKLLSLIENDFVRVNNLINEQVISQVDRIPDVSNHIIELGGKRLRPILTLTTSKICQYKGDMHIKLAAAVELMHTATLLHDDVVDDSDFRNMGVDIETKTLVSNLARISKESGLSGVVCSSEEIEIVRELCGKNFKIIVPGIRPKGSQNNDQKRVMTPKEAIYLGADHLVIGRPITEAKDPKFVVKEILSSIK